MKRWEINFPSWGAFLDVAGKRPRTYGASRRTTERGFSGTPDFPSALALARDGWPEGRANVDKVSAELFNFISNDIQRENISFDVHGDFIDVARFVDNEPECWGVFETVKARGEGVKLVRVLFNITASAGVSAKAMVAKGAVVTALVQLLEFAGHRVELTVCEGTKGDKGGQFVTRILVKEFDQNLDLGRVAFAMAHPSMLRRLWFSLAENLVDREGYGEEFQREMEVGMGYGSPIDVKAEEGEIYVGASSTEKGTATAEINWTNPKAARDWILEKLREQGVAIKRDGVTI